MVSKLAYNIGLLMIQVSCVILAIVYASSPEVIDLNFMMFMLTIVALDLVCWSVYENLVTCKCDVCSDDLVHLDHNAHHIFSMLTLIAGILFFTFFFNLEIGVAGRGPRGCRPACRRSIC